MLFQELHRVLKLDGHIEIVEDGRFRAVLSERRSDHILIDVIFPVLPRWYTQPFRAKSEVDINSPSDGTEQSRGSMSEATDHEDHEDDAEEEGGPPSLASTNGVGHDHELLESLFYSVFTNRSINLKPTSEPAYLHK